MKTNKLSQRFEIKDAPHKKILLSRLFSIITDCVGMGLIQFALLYDLIFNLDGLGNYQISIIVIGLAISIVSSLYCDLPIQKAFLSCKVISFFAFGIGMMLLTINLIGLLIPLRNPSVYQISIRRSDNKVKYTAGEVYANMNKMDNANEQNSTYVKRLNQLIYDGTIHYWVNDPDNTYNLRIPIYENYILYFENLLSEKNEPVEFCRAERAIDRAVSVCSQSALIMWDILNRNDIPTEVIGLSGHVVVRSRVDEIADEWWIVDADYGVIIENLDIFDVDPELVKEAYKGYGQETIEKIVDIYSSERNNYIVRDWNCVAEDEVYLLKWLIPLLSVLPSLFFVAIFLGKRMVKQNQS